jgi:hypothetical protein
VFTGTEPIGTTDAMESEERDDTHEDEAQPPEERDLYPTEVDVQFAFGLIIALMMIFVAGFVMLMIALAGAIG